MYYYVYDQFLQDPKWERDLNAIETRLTDLGIAGKIARLALFRDPTELIRDEIRKGAKTIIAVGNDITLRRAIDACAEKQVAVGVIPLGKEQNAIADILGMPMGVAACDVLSARIMEEMDMGLVNGRRFMHGVTIDCEGEVVVTCDGGIKLHPVHHAKIEIRNLALADENVRAANPTDGKLEVLIRVQERKWIGKGAMHATIYPVKSVRIESTQSMNAAADGESFEANIFDAKVLPGALKIITGKGRKF